MTFRLTNVHFAGTGGDDKDEEEPPPLPQRTPESYIIAVDEGWCSLKLEHKPLVSMIQTPIMAVLPIIIISLLSQEKELSYLRVRKQKVLLFHYLVKTSFMNE